MLVFGDPSSVWAEVAGCIGAVAGGGGYFLSSSNTIHSGVKVENFLAMAQACKKLGAYPLEG